MLLPEWIAAPVLYLRKGLTSDCHGCGLPCKCLPAADGDVHVKRIKLDRTGPATGLVGSKESGAGSDAGIEHDVTPTRAVLNGVNHERRGLDGRMHLKISVTARTPSVDPRIVP